MRSEARNEGENFRSKKYRNESSRTCLGILSRKKSVVRNKEKKMIPLLMGQLDRRQVQHDKIINNWNKKMKVKVVIIKFNEKKVF